MAENIESKVTIVSEEAATEEAQEEATEEEKAQEDKKSRVNVEVLDDAEAATPDQPVYQIRPQLHEKFKPLSAKEIIHNILFDQLSAKSYDTQEAVQWTKDIADMIKHKVKELKFKRYKYIVNVVLGENHGAGVKMGTRCIWDAEADTYAYDSFVNVRIQQLILIFNFFIQLLNFTKNIIYSSTLYIRLYRLMHKCKIYNIC